MKRKKVFITTGIVIGILAIAVGIIMIIMGKEEKIKCPVTGMKLGMSCEEVEKKLKEKEIEWTVGRFKKETWFSVRNIYSDFFETEVQVKLQFFEENKLEEIDVYTVSNAMTHEFCEKIKEKMITYYTKKYGNPKTKLLDEEDSYALYYWETDDWGLRIDFGYDNISIIIGAY